MSKVLMAQDCVTVMTQLRYEKFSIFSRDRRARVAYRLALDMPEKVDKIVVVDIIPTHAISQDLATLAQLCEHITGHSSLSRRHSQRL